MEFFLITLMLLLSAFFSGSEIAFVAANRLRVEVLARRGGFLGGRVQWFFENPQTYLTTTLVGNNLALVLYSTLMAIYLEPPLEAFFVDTLGLSNTPAGLGVLSAQTFIAAILVLIIGEIIPKSVMRETANRAVFMLAIPLFVAYILLWPFILIASWMASFFLRLFGESDGARFMRRDFELMIEETKASGELDMDDDESTLLSRVFALGSIRVRESMVSRTKIEAIDEQTPLEVFLKRCVESGHSKLPVYSDNIDHIIGIAFAYDLFAEPETLADIIRPAQFVPETKYSKDLLREFLETRTSIAIVLDEYGGTAGLVTMEDLLEELFGDIQDEFDTDDEVLRQVDENTVIASGRVEVDELSERFDVVLPAGDYETLAGYLIERLGHIPEANAELEFDGFRFIILQATPHRVDLIRIVRVD